jgi:hypothetical protein
MTRNIHHSRGLRSAKRLAIEKNYCIFSLAHGRHRCELLPDGHGADERRFGARAGVGVGNRGASARGLGNRHCVTKWRRALGAENLPGFFNGNCSSPFVVGRISRGVSLNSRDHFPQI